MNHGYHAPRECNASMITTNIVSLSLSLDEWSQEVCSRAVESNRDDPNLVADFLVSEAVLSQPDQSYEDDGSNSKSNVI